MECKPNEKIGNNIRTQCWTPWRRNKEETHAAEEDATWDSSNHTFHTWMPYTNQTHNEHKKLGVEQEEGHDAKNTKRNYDSCTYTKYIRNWSCKPTHRHNDTCDKTHHKKTATHTDHLSTDSTSQFGLLTRSVLFLGHGPWLPAARPGAASRLP